MSAEILLQIGDTRRVLTSLSEALVYSPITLRMEPGRMRVVDRKACRWLDYGIIKGVTQPEWDISVCAQPEQMIRGLHGELVQGFAQVPVDSVRRCYRADHRFGFGGFVRWVYFVRQEQHGFVGIDWSYVLRPTAGVAHSMRRVWQTVQVLARHGVPLLTEVVLLNARMCEPRNLEAWRMSEQLITVHDWTLRGKKMFNLHSEWCPRCGHRTHDKEAVFCRMCGGRFDVMVCNQ